MKKLGFVLYRLCYKIANIGYKWDKFWCGIAEKINPYNKYFDTYFDAIHKTQ